MRASTMNSPDEHVLKPERREYLTFTLADEEYALDILTVQEIRGYDPVTRIVGAPQFIKGVVNLRGAIVPIVDMRIKLALETVAYTDYEEQFTRWAAAGGALLALEFLLGSLVFRRSP